jgi:hypothetical protein
MVKNAPQPEQHIFSALGMDATCTRVYFAILSEPDLPVSSLAAHLSLSSSEVSRSLDTLADLALLRAARGTPGERRPVTLDRAISILLKRQSEALLAQQTAFSALQSSFEEALVSLAGPRLGGQQCDAEKIIGLDEIQAALESLMVRAKEEVSTVLPGGPQPAESLDAARPLNLDLGARGLRLRSLYQSSMCTDRLNLEYARWCQSIGVEVRCAPVVPDRAIIIDRQIAAIPIDPLNHRDGMLVIREPALVSPLLKLFESHWEQADLLTGNELSRPETGLPTSQERALLGLLATGATDDSAAQKFGISTRTVSRIMANLMNRLGASSRFEAGYKCASNGWIPRVDAGPGARPSRPAVPDSPVAGNPAGPPQDNRRRPA